MTWHILLVDSDGHKYTSSGLRTREEALHFACDLLREGDLKILKIEDTQRETIELEEVWLWAEAARSRRTATGRMALRKRNSSGSLPNSRDQATDAIGTGETALDSSTTKR